MSKIPLWKTEYSVNNELIDLQHRYIFELCRTLTQLQDQPVNGLSIKEAVAGLLDYIELHFREEEELYRSHPQFLAHRAMHQELIRKTEEFASKLEVGSLELSALVDFVYEWIIGHITQTDIRYFHDMAEG